MQISSSTYEKIRSAAVVSFDIFDTLIGRTVASPSDVFRLMENEISELVGLPLANFDKLRQSAEKSAKKRAFEFNGVEEVSLRDIHFEMLSHIGASLDVIEESCDIEMAWERRCLIPREAGKQLYELSRQLHKDIILVSDMYLPKAFIEEILASHGYDGWVKFYLSADLGRTKSSGTIFQDVIADFRCGCERVVHIGDNPKGDVSVPRKLGIQTIQTPRTVNLLKDRFSFSRSTHQGLVVSNRTISSSVVSQMLADSIFDDPGTFNASAFRGDPLLFGRALLGPLMAGYAAWLHNHARNSGIQKLLFLSRDGLVMQRAYNVMLGKDAIDNNYCLASRRIARICSIYSEWDIRRILDEPIYSTEIGNYLDFRLGLRPDDLDTEKLISLGYSSHSQKIGNKTNRDTLYELVSHHRDLILSNAIEQRRIYRDYLKEAVGTADKVAVVDIGYAGTMQAAISRLLDKNISGYYLAVDGKISTNNSLTAAHAYLLPDVVSTTTTKDIGINKHRFIYETIICSSEYSFEGFDIKSPTALPVYWEHSDATKRSNFVALAHEGVFQFCEDLMQRWPLEKDKFALEGHRASLPLDSFLRDPPPADVAILQGIEFEDSFGPDIKRVVVAEPRTKASHPVQEIWVEGRAVVKKANKASEASDTNDVSGQRQARNALQYLLSFKLIERTIGKIENAVITALFSVNKARKYEKDRQRFFLESQNRFVRGWGRVTS